MKNLFIEIIKHDQEVKMNTSSLIGHSVTHISYGPGEILTANDKLVMVRFETGEYRKFQFPQAFASYLTIDDDSLQAEVLDIDKERKQQADAEKMQKGAENAAEEARRTNEAKSLAVAPQKASRPKLARGPKTVNMTEVHMYGDGIIGPETSFATHADVLNTLFGYRYKHFQKAYKNLENGYGVWFPNIASRVGDKYLSSDEYWGWVNILSDAGDTVTQIDNPEYTYSGTGEPDKNKCFIFARFERNKRYTFIGLFGPARRAGNKTIRTRIGEIVDIKNMKILQ